MVEKAFSLVVSSLRIDLIFHLSFLRLLAAIPFTAAVASAKIAPRLEIYTVLACSVHKPDISGQDFGHVLLGLPVFALPPHSYGLTGTSLDSFRSFNASACGSDPVVQAAVAKLMAGLSTCLSPLTSSLYAPLVITGCTGVLSLVTTGYWCAVSQSINT